MANQVQCRMCQTVVEYDPATVTDGAVKCTQCGERIAIGHDSSRSSRRKRETEFAFDAPAPHKEETVAAHPVSAAAPVAPAPAPITADQAPTQSRPEAEAKDPYVGQAIGKYLLERRLDQGDRSMVYIAQNKELGSAATIKIYKPEYCRQIKVSEGEFLAQVRRRAAVVQENVIRVIDLIHQGEIYGLITEYVDGCRLEERISAKGPMPTREALETVIPIAKAMKALHEGGVLHCDLTPYNILEARTGILKVAGFGFTSLPTEDDLSTDAAHFVAPELGTQECAPTPRCDVYSLGCLFYYVLTGRPPYSGATREEIFRQHTAAPTPDPRRIDSTIAEEVVEVLQRLMTKDPSGRPQSADEALALLQPLLQAAPAKDTTTYEPGVGGGQRLFEKLLRKMPDFEASDLQLKVGAPPAYRIHGETRTTNAPALTREQMAMIIRDILDPHQTEKLENNRSFDLSTSIGNVGRFRINIFHQRGAPSITVRIVSNTIPTPEQLLLPPGLTTVGDHRDGLVLVTGATGSGKSTTIATVIDHINNSRHAHIITIEDPIEYVHQDKLSFLTQREIGIDVPDFLGGIRDALRQAPDVILLGELRDEETVETAIAASETGHLVLSTLHAINCIEAVRRVLLFFPADRQDSLRKLLAGVLRAAMSQRMVPGCTPERRRVVIMELLLINENIRQCIAENEDYRIEKYLETFAHEGCQSYNINLLNLIKNGLVDPRIALQESPRPKDLEKMIATWQKSFGGQG